MKLGFVGLGHLGKAIAGRLLDQGHELVVWNRSPDKAADLPATRVARAESPAAVARDCDVIFLCLFDSAAVRAVLDGDRGLLAGAVQGKRIIDLSTNHFRDVLDFHEQCRAAGVDYLESPVLGSVVPAQNGALTVVVSGDREAFDRSRSLYNDIGQHVFHFDTPAQATKMKLINNLTLGSFMATLAEALALGEDVGIDKGNVLEILGVGGGNSMVLNAKKAKLMDEDFAPHFTSALIHKDLHCLQDLAYERKRPLYTAALTKELYARTYAEGIDQQDFAGIYQLFKGGND